MSKESEIREVMVQFEKDVLDYEKIPLQDTGCLSVDSEANEPIMKYRMGMGKRFTNGVKAIKFKYGIIEKLIESGIPEDKAKQLGVEIVAMRKEQVEEN